MGEEEGGEVSMPGSSPSTGWLGPEITGASRKIISICLGHGKAGPQAPPPAGNSPPRPHPSAQAHRPCPHPPRGQLKLVERQASTHPGRKVWVQGRRPGRRGSGLSVGRPGVGGPVRALGNPGRLLVAPALAAAQGVCGNDTARAAEIPPPDIGWKVEQLVRDNQWRSIAARRGRAARGRGSGAGIRG